ncbi:MAG TPA: alpha-hydroxy acid oxidase [Stellaceae bacterium]|nr:alpha-hydroxy acid oxidase [Stellaceae bacterium]
MYHHALNVEEIRRLARRRLPRGMFEYIDRGAEDEVALSATRAALDGVKLHPRVLTDVSRRTLGVELFGQRQPLPLIVAPTGLAGLMWHEGEVELAKAAAAAGVPFGVSTQSITPIETIAKKAGGRLWFQLYVLNDRTITEHFIDRARDAGAEALILTVDTVVAPKREYNIHNGFGIPMRATWRGGLDLAAHPGWLWRVLGRYLRDGGIPTYAHYPSEFRHKITRAALSDRLGLAADMTWADLDALRQRWHGKLIVKGVLRADDAIRAAECGADAIVVSNHGGRNLDGAVSPVEVLPEIVQAVGHRLTVLADGGVRRGSDVVKLMALGAQAVLVGRSVLFGTAVAGQAGATHVLNLLRDEISRTLALLGCPSLDRIGEGYVRPRGP